MNCPKCDGEIRISHTFSGKGFKSQRAVCEKCLSVLTLVTEVAAIDPGYGQGAEAVAKKLNKKGPVQGPESRKKV